MNAVKLDNVSASEIRKFYEEELERTLQRLGHIKRVLDQLGDQATKLELNVVKPGHGTIGHSEEAIATGNASSAGKSVARSGKRRGPKAVWESLVLKRLRQLDRPVTYEQLTDEIMVFSKLPEEKRTNTKRAIVNVAFKLRNRDQKIDTFSNGKREKYVALRSWFDDEGNIRKEYLDKIEA